MYHVAHVFVDFCRTFGFASYFKLEPFIPIPKKTENAPDKFHCDQQVSVELPLFTERKNIHFCVRYEAFCIAG